MENKFINTEYFEKDKGGLSLSLLVFDKPEGLLEYVSRRISELENTLRELNERYTEVKIRAERLLEIEKLFNEILGVKLSNIREMDIKGVRVVMDARPTDEVKVYEEVIASLQERIDVLKRIHREVISPLVERLKTYENISFIVEVSNDIPTRILIRLGE